jgi:hypothetical protein
MAFTPSAALPLPNGRLLVAGTAGTKANAGYPVHLLNVSGQIERSLGSVDGRLPPHCGSCLQRAITFAADSTSIWTVSSFRYTLERWDLNGLLLETVPVKNAWFQEWDPTDGKARQSGPEPTTPHIQTSISQIVLDAASGLLLVRGTLPDLTAPRENIPSRSAAPAQGIVSRNEYQPRKVALGVFPSRATVIDLVDPSTGMVLRSGRWSGRLIELMGHGLAYSRSEDDAGRPMLDIWRLSFSQ